MSGYDFAGAYQENESALAGDVLPEGEYDVECRSAKSVTTAGGKPAIRMQLVVISGPNAGRTVPDQRTWSPESEPAMRIFRHAMDVLGATKEWIVATGATGDQIAEKIVGGRASVFLKVGEFNGQPRNDVNYKKALPPEEMPSVAPAVPAQAQTQSPAWP